MSRKDIEARLDRSLANQVKVPRLDARFDAAVWARIEAAEAAATNPGRSAEPARASSASRWIAISNIVGIAVALAVALYFVLPAAAGVELPVNDVGASLPAIPTIPDDMVARIVGVLGQVLGFVALAFGLSFTSVGRRFRASFF
jgi:hypothetical protein